MPERFQRSRRVSVTDRESSLQRLEHHDMRQLLLLAVLVVFTDYVQADGEGGGLLNWGLSSGSGESWASNGENSQQHSQTQLGNSWSGSQLGNSYQGSSQTQEGWGGGSSRQGEAELAAYGQGSTADYLASGGTIPYTSGNAGGE